MNFLTDLGEKLRQARDKAGFSQQEAADVIGVAREVLSYWENDRRVPSVVQLRRLAHLYGVDSAVFTGEPSRDVQVERVALLRGLTAGAPEARMGLNRWFAFLDEWADLLEECGLEDQLPGLGRPPVASWASERPRTDSREAPRFALEVREHFKLGLDAIPNLYAFLEQKVLVFEVSLGKVEGKGVSGAFCNHPKLGYCILVNRDTTPGRQVFTLAHEYCHALFHFQEGNIVSLLGDSDRKERFADVFAAHFLIPAPMLHSLVEFIAGKDVRDAWLVLLIQRYFRVSYAMALYRLFSEGLISQAQYDEFKGISPRSLAEQLGYDTREYQIPAVPTSINLGTYPTSILKQVRQFVEDEVLSPSAAASLLDVSLEVILEELLALPEEASQEEQREFNEMPAPPKPRSKAGATPR
jgi:Zn-dependent peptidase ImmA (M78 family)/DNA-binding XRE family transcriptional regulator